MSRDIEDLLDVVKRGAIELKKRMSEKGYDLGISSTYRSIEEQNGLYEQGRTTSGNIVTNARGGDSWHNYRLAFDIFKNIKGQEWSDNSFFQTAGDIWADMGGEWGGNWTSFVDKPHFQFTNGLTLKDLKAGKTVGANVKMKWEMQANTIYEANHPPKDKIEIEVPKPEIKKEKEYIVIQTSDDHTLISRENLTKLIEFDIIKTPNYWINLKIDYINDLIDNVSPRLNKEPINEIADLDAGLRLLVKKNVIKSPVYWIDKCKEVENLSTLLIELAKRTE